MIQKQDKRAGGSEIRLRIILLLSVCAGITAIAVMLWLRYKGPGQSAENGQGFTDVQHRELRVPEQVDRVICSGAGCLRLLTYLQAHDRIVAVDSIERRGSPLDARPYAIANPQFRTYPLFGEFRGWDNAELIAGLQPQPQVIFKIAGGRGQDPALLEKKTGIPVIVLEYGNLTYGRELLDRSLRRMGSVMGKSTRAEEVIAYFDSLEQDLKKRTQNAATERPPACYIAGLGRSGPHGLRSTDPSFAPFQFTHVRNVADECAGDRLSHAAAAKEQIVMWDPEVIFLDVSTLRLQAGANALDELRNDPVYQSLSAVRAGRVYGLFPSNSYNRNLDAVFANAYYVGKVLYPEKFEDVDPLARAEEISAFLNGGPAFAALNEEFSGLAFKRIDVK